MALFKNIFSLEKGKSGRNAVKPCKIQASDITPDSLKKLIPIRNLSEEELTAFAFDKKSEVFGKGTILFATGEEVDSIIYLLEGTVSMETENGMKYEIDSDMAKAHFPLSSGKQHATTATAVTDVDILRVSNKIMREKGSSSTRLVEDLEELSIPEQLKGSHLFQSFCQNYRDNELNLPTLPDIAIKLRKGMQQDIGISDATRIVQLDAVIAAKLIHIANSPLYLASKPVNNCHDAVNRLGLNATRNLVVSFCMRNVFKSDKKPFMKMMKDVWKESIQTSCLSYVLACENKDSVDPEEALLAGLICDIGIIPFLQFAENFPTDYYDSDEIQLAIPVVRGPVGAKVLSKWGFPNDLVEVPITAEDWFHDSGGPLSTADIVRLSKLHSHIGTSSMSEYPAINSIPACGKLKDGMLSPEYSLNVLHEAHDKVQEALQFFDA